MEYVECTKMLYQHPTNIQMTLAVNLFMPHGHALLNSMDVAHSWRCDTDIIKTSNVFEEGEKIRLEQLWILKKCMNSYKI